MLKVYSRRNCERCARIKKELTAKGLHWMEYIIGEDVDRETVVKMFPDVKQLPIVVKNGQQVDPKDL